MKRIAILLCLFLMMGMSSYARTFVLAVGISNYGGNANNLSQSTKDAKAFREVMSTQTNDITLLTSSNATKANVMEKLRAICNRAQNTDRIIFYYSGHGCVGGICCYNSVLTYSELVNLLATSSAKEKICFIDACHAGSVADDKQLSGKASISTATKGHSDQAFIVGCRSDEYSIEGPWVGAGFLTQGLIKGLRGKADRDGDRKVTLMELFKYTYNDVVTRSTRSTQSKQVQHPQLIAPSQMYDIVVAKW